MVTPCQDQSRAIGSSSRDVNLRLPFAGGWVGDLKSERKVETEQLTSARSLFAMLPVFDKIFIGRKVISLGRRSSLIKMTGLTHSSSDCSKTLHENAEKIYFFEGVALTHFQPQEY